MVLVEGDLLPKSNASNEMKFVASPFIDKSRHKGKVHTLSIGNWVAFLKEKLFAGIVTSIKGKDLTINIWEITKNYKLRFLPTLKTFLKEDEKQYDVTGKNKKKKKQEKKKKKQEKIKIKIK